MTHATPQPKRAHDGGLVSRPRKTFGGPLAPYSGCKCGQCPTCIDPASWGDGDLVLLVRDSLGVIEMPGLKVSEDCVWGRYRNIRAVPSNHLAAGRTVVRKALSYKDDNMITHTEKQVALKTVLVVEDEGLIAMDLKRRLESLGYIVPAFATTADDAVRLAALHLPDLILMDVHLKGEKDGIDAAGEIRKNAMSQSSS